MKIIIPVTFACLLMASFSSCNSFFKFSHGSLTREQAGSRWFAKIVQDGNQHELEALTFYFSRTGKVVANCRSCDVNGYWYEDEIANKFTMSFEPNDVLCELNKSWDVKFSSSSKIVLNSRENDHPFTVTILIP